MQYEREKKQTDKLKKLKKLKRRKRNLKKQASCDEEQGEICLTCWCLLSDFFLDLSLVFSQLQVLLSYS